MTYSETVKAIRDMGWVILELFHDAAGGTKMFLSKGSFKLEVADCKGEEHLALQALAAVQALEEKR